MRNKLLYILFFAVALLVGCAKDHTEDINAINNRLDVLEQTTIPSIEEQIETINLAIDQLKEVDTAIQKEIESLKSSAQDASNKIAASSCTIDLPISCRV